MSTHLLHIVAHVSHICLHARRYVACTGTNFCLRVHPLADCGWFPDYSITEDYTLGMELKAKGYKVCFGWIWAEINPFSGEVVVANGACC